MTSQSFEEKLLTSLSSFTMAEESSLLNLNGAKFSSLSIALTQEKSKLSGRLGLPISGLAWLTKYGNFSEIAVPAKN